MVAEVVGHRLARVEHLLDPRVGDVARDDEWSGQRQPGAHGVFRQFGADLGHRAGEIDAYDVVIEVLVGDVRKVVGRVALELLEEHPFRGDLPERLAVSRT